MLFDKRMTFGRYKGWLVSDLTDSYLVWLTEKCTYLNHPRNEQLKTAIEYEIEDRVYKSIPPAVKARLRVLRDYYYLNYWVNETGSWFRVGWPEHLPSDDGLWIDPYDYRFSLESHEFSEIENRIVEPYRRSFGHRRWKSYDVE